MGADTCHDRRTKWQTQPSKVLSALTAAAPGNAHPRCDDSKVQISFDPTETSATNVRIGTSSSSGETLVLPAGAIPITTAIMTIGGATGGTNPTVDIGTSADDDGLFNEVDADVTGTIKSC